MGADGHPFGRANEGIAKVPARATFSFPERVVGAREPQTIVLSERRCRLARGN